MKRRTIRFVRLAWAFYAQAAAVFVLSLLVGYGLVITFRTDENQPVVTLTGGPYAVTTSVPYRGQVSYAMDLVRSASCPGYVVYTLVSKTDHGPPAIVTFRRPIVSTEIKKFDKVPANIQLPDSVFPARWLFQSSVDSRCPTFERSDVLATFEFEVTAQ